MPFLFNPKISSSEKKTKAAFPEIRLLGNEQKKKVWTYMVVHEVPQPL